MKLEKYSMGVGDRFARQGRAQLAAFLQARECGIEVAPVWNKSHREHQIVGTGPADVRLEADRAVSELSWDGAYHVDADHIGIENVDLFVEASDFFTLDVADFTGCATDDAAIDKFVADHRRYIGRVSVPGIDAPLDIREGKVRDIAAKYLLAVREAGRIYRHIEAVKGGDLFITEVSMDETDEPQTPVEMFFILAAIADEGIPAQTIAPKFTGRFNKGVDYVGDVGLFEREFREDLAVIELAVREFGLPSNLKLSVHSGSDKFSLYAPINRALHDTGAGLHIKTAGTTWLEELIGLAASGEDGLRLSATIYAEAVARFDEMCAPYATVIDVDRARLPDPDEVVLWSGEDYVAALKHDPGDHRYNADFRQILHVAYKVAAEMGERYLDALSCHEAAIAPHVTANILHRHLLPVFGS